MPPPPSLPSSLAAWDAQLSSTAAGYFARLYAGFYAISTLAALWVYCVARRLPPGPWRALAVLPVLLLQLCATPFLVDRSRTAVLVVPVCGVLSLSAFKVAAYAMGRGPLAMSQCSWTQNLLQFGVVLALPVVPKDAFKLGAGASVSDLGSQAPATWPTFLKLYGTKAAGATVAASLAIWPVLPQLLRHWFYALCLSLTLGALWDFWCCVAVAFAGIPVAPSFDQPWLSTSFADYWSRRWNLTTSYLLRVLVYEPVREGRFMPAAPPGTTPATATTATAAPPNGRAHHGTPAAKPAAAAAPAGPDDDGDSTTASTASAMMAADPLGSSPQHLTNSSSSNSSGSLVDGGSEPDSATGSFCDLTAEEDCSLLLDPSPETASAAAGKGGSTYRVNRHHQQQQQQMVGTSPPDSPTPTPLPPAAAPAAHTPAAPGQEGRTKPAARQETPTQAILRRVAATHATFFFSGLWHMLIFYYATGLLTHHWLLFFTLQGPIMVAETALKHFAKQRGLKLPVPLSIFAANFLLIVVARPLFFGPCDWSGLCSAMMDNVKTSVV